MKTLTSLTILLATLATSPGAINIAMHNGGVTVNGMSTRPDGNVVQTSVDTWNNPARNGGVGYSFTGFALLDDTGAGTTATLDGTTTVTGFNNNGWGSGTDDHVMMEGWYAFRDAEFLTVNNLPAEFTSGGYAIFIYGDPKAVRTMDYFIGGQQQTINSPANFFGGTFIDGTNYTVFTGQTAASFTITGNVVSTGRSTINGLRIVPNSELPLLITSFTTTDLFVAPSTMVTLDWTTSGSTGLTLDPGALDVTGLTTTDVTVNADTTYTLSATDGVDTIMESLTIRVAPVINLFECVEKTARDTADVRFVWDTLGAETLVINDGSSDVFTTSDPGIIAGGTTSLAGITTDTTFTLTATFPGSNPAMATSSIDIRSGADPVSFEETILADGPLAFYRFEETSADAIVLLDHTSNNRDSLELTAGNITTNQPGAVGSCWEFTNGSVLLDLNPDPSLGDISIALLARYDVNGGTHSLVSQQDNTGTGRSLLQIRGGAGNQVGTWLGDTGFVSSTVAPAINDWCHYAFIYDNTDSELRFYVNGVHTHTELGPIASSTIGNYVLAANKGRTAEFLRGALDEVAVFDYQLDDPDGDGDDVDSKIPTQYAAYLQDSAPLLGFSASATNITIGDSIDLNWKVGDAATTIDIDNGPGDVTGSTANGVGTTSVSPTATTTYTITVNGTETRQVTIIVNIPLLITAAGFNGSDDFEVTAINLVEGLDYDLFFSEDPDTIGWTAVGIQITADNTGTATFIDTFVDPVTFPTFFYRVEEVPVP